MKNLFFNSKKFIADLQPSLVQLEKEVAAIEAMENKVEAIVRLFQVISPLQDAGGFAQQINLLKKNSSRKRKNEIRALEILQTHLRRAGRDEFGLNRTRPGEAVTAEKVYLGNVFGIWTKTASYWLANQARLEQEFRPDVSKNPNQPVSSWYLINDYQCDSFITSHTKGIKDQIQILKAVN